jgi:hypothetical protein
VTVSCQSFDLLPGLHPPVKSVSNEKRILLSFVRREPSLRTLAGFFARLVDVFQTYLEVRVNLPDVSHYRQVIVHEGGAV